MEQLGDARGLLEVQRRCPIPNAYIHKCTYSSRMSNWGDLDCAAGAGLGGLARVSFRNRPWGASIAEAVLDLIRHPGQMGNYCCGLRNIFGGRVLSTLRRFRRCWCIRSSTGRECPSRPGLADKAQSVHDGEVQFRVARTWNRVVLGQAGPQEGAFGSSWSLPNTKPWSAQVCVLPLKAELGESGLPSWG